MSFVKVENGSFPVNFLESEVGLVLKTYELSQSLGVVDGKKTVVKAGTIYPANNNTAVGIVLNDVDVTDGNMPGAVMVAGRVLADRLDIATAAKTAMTEIVVVTGPDTTR